MPYPATYPVPPLRLALTVILLFCATHTVAGQAWTMPAGTSYLKLTYGHVTAARQYTFDGRSADFIDGIQRDTFKDRSLYFYSETGLTEKLTLVLSLPYKRTFVEDQAFRYRTFAPGTAMVGMRVALLPLLGIGPSGQALAANLVVNIPMGYTRNYTPSAGAGQIDLQAGLSYGLSFYPFPGYTQAGFGYRYRTTAYGFSRAVNCQEGRDINCIRDRKPAFGHELFYAFEAGLTPLSGGLLLQVLVNGVWSVDTPTVGFTALNPIPTRQRYLKVGGGLAVYPLRLAGTRTLEALGLSLQYFATPSGRNTIKSDDFFFGLEYRLPLF